VVTATADRLGEVLRLAQQAAPQDVPELAGRVGRALGATLLVYVVDYGQTELVPLAGDGIPAREPVPVEGSLAGRAYTTLEPCVSPGTGEYRLWVPLATGPLRVGVLEVLPGSTAAAGQRELWSAVAALFAQLLADRGQYGDALELARRRLPMQAATEVVWSLLPPVSFANNQVAVSAILEPCYEVGGDVFDYSVDRGPVHVALFDAMGHGMAAALLSALAVNAYRNARRCGLDLTDRYLSVDKWIRARYPGSFVTAVLGEFDPRTGRYRRISAGHPAELLLRDGHPVRAFPAPTAMPLGMADLMHGPPEVTEHEVQPGDQLLLYTDGVVDARSESGEQFGVDRLADFLGRAIASQLPQPEIMRRLVRAILDHQHEQLQDDATAMCLRYGGSDPH
jgi:serine phosphatase RsbU (regulator of sigma subunit)